MLKYKCIKEERSKAGLAAEGKAGLNQFSMHEYVLAAEALLCSKRTQLQAIKAEATKKEQSNTKKKLLEHSDTIKSCNISQTAQFQVTTQSRQQGTDIATPGHGSSHSFGTALRQARKIHWMSFKKILLNPYIVPRADQKGHRSLWPAPCHQRKTLVRQTQLTR